MSSRFSVLPSASSLNAGDYILVDQVDVNSPTGYTTRKISAQTLGDLVGDLSAVKVESQTAGAGQTVFTVVNQYLPGSGDLVVFADGFYVPPPDYTQTNSSTVTFNVGWPANVSLTFLTGRLTTITTNGSNVSVQLVGTGTTIRSVNSRAMDTRSLNDYTGADPTFSTDSSAALTNYGTDTQAYTIPVETKNHAPIYIDEGNYEVSPESFVGCQSIIGRGKDCSILTLKAGATGPLITQIAQDNPGTSNDDSNRPSIRNLTLLGNLVDRTTVGTSHAIYLPDAPFLQSTQYGSGVEIDNVEIRGFTGSGVYLGGNRNWSLINKLVVRYCNADGITSYGYDNRIFSTDLGECTGTGFNMQAGGANVINANIYGNLYNMQITSFVNSTNTLLGSFLDIAQKDALLIGAGAATTQIYGGRFYANGKLADNTYADIHTASHVVVLGTDFLTDGLGVRVKFNVQVDSSGATVNFHPGTLDTSGGAGSPYASFVTDSYPALIFNGLNNAYWGPLASSELSAVINGTEMVRIDSSEGFATNHASLLTSALQNLVNQAGAQTATLTNSPYAGNPTKWVSINIAGKTYYSPLWSAP